MSISNRDGKKLYEGFKSYAKMGGGESSMIVRKYVLKNHFQCAILSFTKKYDTLGVINQSGVGIMLEKNIENYLIKQLQGLKYIYRYLTTEKSEEPIDLYAVNKKLIEIEKAI